MSKAVSIDNRIDSGEAYRYSLVKNRINEITIYRIDKHTSRKEDRGGGGSVIHEP